MPPKVAAGETYLSDTRAYIDDLLNGAAPLRSQDELDELADFNKDGRLDRYKLADKYYRGEQETSLTDRLKQYLQRSGLEYNENICAVVVESYAERLTIVGVTTSADPKKPVDPTDPLDPGKLVPPPPPSFADWLWERVWDGSLGDERMIEAHSTSARLGDSFVIVDYDTERRRPRIVPQLPEQMRIVYSNGTKKLAIKKWYTDEIGPVNEEGRNVCRMNIYVKDRIEKWFRLAKAEAQGGWLEWIEFGDSDTLTAPWPTPWVAEGGLGLGIPVFHFANNPDSSGYGIYEHRVVVPLQDRLNKELIDLSAILDQLGWPQRYASGLADTSTLNSEPGTVWHTENHEATWGQFTAADPGGPLKSIESTIGRASKISRTPHHMLDLTGGTPSGEALKTADSGLVSKVEGRRPRIGNQWTEALRMAALVALVFGGTEKDEKPSIGIDEVRHVSININWKDPRTFDEAAHLAALQAMMALGVPVEYLWSRIEGLDVEAVKQMKAADDRANAAQMVAAFNRGGDTNPLDPGQGRPRQPKTREEAYEYGADGRVVRVKTSEV